MVRTTRRRLVGLVAAVVVAVLTGLVPAGSYPPAGAQADGVPLLGEDEVQILVAIVDDYPAVELVVAVPPVLAGDDLSSSAFTLAENGVSRKVTVEPSRDRLEVVLVVDTSGSMGGASLTAALDAAAGFVAGLPADARVAVVGFGGGPNVAAAFTDPEAAIAAIETLEIGGETALYDGVVTASGLFGVAAEGHRRFMVVLSDGNDTVSASGAVDARAALDGSGAYLYSVTLGSEDTDFAGLIQLTRWTGGRVVPTSDGVDLDSVYADLALRLTSQYRVRYDSLARGEADISLLVRRGAIVGTASGTVDLGAVTGAGGPEPTPVPAVTGPLVVSEPEVIRPGDPGLLATNAALYIGAGVVFLLGAALLTLVFTKERDRRPTRIRPALRTSGVRRQSGLHGVVGVASGFADKALSKRQQGRDLDAALDRAGLDMRPGEFVTAVAGFAVLGAALGALFIGPLGIAVVPLLVALVSRVVLQAKAAKRRKQFEVQLSDTLVILSGGLRAGHGVMQALDSVAMQADAPTSEEFSRVLAETRIGRDVIDSLDDVARRTGSEDFVWVVRAIAINRELGGDLAEILDNVGETIRERSRLKDQVKALSAEGKVSAMILFVLPIGLTGFVRTSNPEYLAEMTGTTGGQIALGFAALLMVLGGIWLKKLVSVEF